MIAVITDSTAGFTKEEALENNIIVLPMYLINGDTENTETYLNNETEKTQKFSNFFSLKTASTNVNDFYRAFNALTSAGHQVICITISSRFSSAFANAVTAKNILNNNNIEVIDSKATAGGLYMLVKDAVSAIKNGENFRNTVEHIYKTREKIGIVFSVDDLTALRKSGRMGLVSHSAVTILNMRPILSCKNGTIIYNGIVRGTSSQIKKLIDCVPKNSKYIIIHAKKDNPKLKVLAEGIKNKFSNFKIKDFSSVLTVHLGYSAIGIAWLAD